MPDEIRGIDEILRKLEKFKQWRTNARDSMNRIGAKFVEYSKSQRFRTGGAGKGGRGLPAIPGILTIRTARLQRAIRHVVRDTNDGLQLSFGVADVVYARIHEYGGQAGRNLAAYIPPRPYLQPAVAANIDWARVEIALCIDRTLRGSRLV